MNRIENHCLRWNAVVGREIEFSLPVVLGIDKNIQLALSFAHWICDKYSVIGDLGIHAPRPDDEIFGKSNDNIHAHLLLSPYYYNEDQLGHKCVMLDPLSAKHQAFPKSTLIDRIVWQSFCNEALLSNGFEPSADARSFIERGITDQIPTVHRGPDKKTWVNADKNSSSHLPTEVSRKRRKKRESLLKTGWTRDPKVVCDLIETHTEMALTLAAFDFDKIQILDRAARLAVPFIEFERLRDDDQDDTCWSPRLC